jgi:hypothetical protein
MTPEEDEERLPKGKYSIVNPEFVKGLMRGRDFWNMRFDDLKPVVYVIGLDDGDWVTYAVDGDKKDYNMELYPFERIYKKID